MPTYRQAACYSVGDWFDTHPPDALQRSLWVSPPCRDSPPRNAACCKAVRSGARLIWDRTPHQPNRGEHDGRAPVHRRLPAVPCGHGVSHAARSCRRRNAAARSRPHCRQRHRCSLRSIRRFSGVSGCPLPQWPGISARRILRRSILGKWTTAVLSTNPAPATKITSLRSITYKLRPATTIRAQLALDSFCSSLPRVRLTRPHLEHEAILTLDDNNARR